jgi:hypothetical protein
MLRFPRSSVSRLAWAAWSVLSWHGTAWAGLQFQFDYRYDSRGFFNAPERREALETAGRMVNRYVDSLEAIIPSPPTNTWSSFFTPPDNSSSIILSNLEVPADTMQIFVGGADIDGRLAQAIDTAPVGFGSPEWKAIVSYRGEPGAALRPATDFGPMGGTITFNDDPSEFQWHFSDSTTGLESKEFDFITVAMHEILHLLGVGISVSWNDQVNDVRQFTGPAARLVGSPTNPNLELDATEAHWKSGTKSTWNGKVQEALLAPGIFPGRRAFVTALDRAVLRDLGWEDALPGDANRDRAFDSGDLLAVFQGGRYETERLAAWSEGDWDDNAMFDSSDLIAALQTGTYELPPTAVAGADTDFTTQLSDPSGPLEVAYDPVSGKVSVHTNGDKLTALQFTSTSRQLRPLLETADGPFDLRREDQWFHMDVHGFSDQDLGALFPRDALLLDLQSDITVSGAWLGGGAIEDVAWRVVPEPSALGLAMLGTLLLPAVRRPRGPRG